MQETGHVQVYLGGEEETALGDDSVFGSESETEDGSLEPTSPASPDSEDGCFKYIKMKGIKIFTGFRKKKTKPQMTRAFSSMSTQSGSVSGSDAELASLSGSVSEPLPSNIPDYYATDEYFFGYPKRGYAVIINNETFDPESGFGDRAGSQEDENKLREIFKTLGFRVKAYKNLRGNQIAAKMEKMAEKDHTDKDCFACAILTHGAGQGRTKEGVPVVCDVIFGTDGEAVATHLLMELFNDDNCSSLTGKPRLFFIQACRGDKFDLGTKVDVYGEFPTATQTKSAGEDVKDAQDPDAPEKDAGEVHMNLSVPRYRDFLMAYATPPGYYAWRRTEGSWFIMSLWYAVMTAKLEEESLLDMLTFCSWIQAMDFETNTTDPKMSGRKSVPQIAHMLTKEVYFRPKSRASQ